MNGVGIGMGNGTLITHPSQHQQSYFASLALDEVAEEKLIAKIEGRMESRLSALYTQLLDAERRALEAAFDARSAKAQSEANALNALLERSMKRSVISHSSSTNTSPTPMYSSLRGSSLSSHSLPFPAAGTDNPSSSTPPQRRSGSFTADFKSPVEEQREADRRRVEGIPGPSERRKKMERCGTSAASSLKAQRQQEAPLGPRMPPLHAGKRKKKPFLTR